METVTTFLQSLQSAWTQIVAFLPKLIGALVLLIAGWLVAKLARKAAVKVFKILRIETVAEKSGIEDFLIKGGVPFTTVSILGSLIYWFVMLIVFLAVLNSLGLEAAAALFDKIVLYIPNVLVAVVVLLFGTLFAKLVQGVSQSYLSNVGVAGAVLMSTVAYYAIIIFVISVALEQLAIGGLVLVSAFQIAFGALCLALALAFGLGGRDWAAHVLEKLRKKP
jgi:hypothetical protein